MRFLFWLLAPVAAFAAGYSAQVVTIDGVEVARLADTEHSLEVSVIPSVGDMAYEFKANGVNVLAFGYSGPADFKRRPGMCCIPFMAPWTNGVRDTYTANGQRYTLNTALLKAGEGPMRGMLMYSPHWKVVSCSADDRSAVLVSKLEFWKVPNLMVQFPFAHTITMTHRLSGGVLEVETSIENHAIEAMPLVIGFHPYFKLADSPRTAWSLHIPAKQFMPLAPTGLPTGQRSEMDLPEVYALGKVELSKVFTALAAGEDGNAHFSLRGVKQQIDVAFGPKYRIAVVYAPPESNYINIEPLTGVGNALELAQKGLYQDLQSIPPGGTWKESFRVTPSGF